MRESISYTVTLNFVITFIIIVFAFLSATLIYFKSNKVGNIITNSIEKYEGYNSLSEEEIGLKLTAIGYNMRSITCNSEIRDRKNGNVICNLVTIPSGTGEKAYCIYLCEEEDYYYYRIRTNMMINLPIVNELLNIPIYSNSNRMFDFEMINKTNSNGT